MTEQELNFAEMVDKLAKPGKEIVRELTGSDAHLLHMAIGISGEAGELLDCIKKLVIYRKPFTAATLENIVEELGDLEFYIQGIRSALQITRPSVLRANMEKLLGKRYSQGTYSNEQAIERADKQESADDTQNDSGAN